MRKNKQYAVDIMYNYGTDNTIQISEFVKNYKENLIFIDNEYKKSENRLLKSPIRYKKRYANPNKHTKNKTG